MKNIVIATDGTKKASTKKSADCTYVQYDSDTLMVHFSEASEVTKDQLKAIGDVVEKACKGKLVARVKQRSANVVGFSLKKNSDMVAADSSMQTACNEIIDEAKKANAKLKGSGNSGNSGSGNGNNGGNGGNSGNSSGNGNGTGNNGNGNGNSANGNSSGNANGNGNGNSGNGNSSDNANGNGNRNSANGNSSGNANGNGNSGNGNGNGNGSGNSFDKSKDIFGRDLKQSYPGLFWPGMSPAEEQAAYDSYWNMVTHVDKDIFGRK